MWQSIVVILVSKPFYYTTLTIIVHSKLCIRNSRLRCILQKRINWVKISFFDVTQSYYFKKWPKYYIYHSFMTIFEVHKNKKNFVQENRSRCWNNIMLLLLVAPSIINLDFLNELCLPPNWFFSHGPIPIRGYFSGSLRVCTQ